MNFDKIRKNLDKIIAERVMARQGEEFERLFGFRPPPRYGFSGFRDAEGRMRIPDDGKTITLTKDDYRVVEEDG